jgi:hypothetical protein
LLFVSYYYPVRSLLVFERSPKLVVQAVPPPARPVPAPSAAARAVS